MLTTIPPSAEIVSALSRLDGFRGQWSQSPGMPLQRLGRIEEAARVQSTGSSARLAGFRVSDADVAALLNGDAVPLRDSLEILGYAAAMTASFPGGERLLSVEDLQRLHAVLIGKPGESGWRKQPLHSEAFDASGRATGLVFPTLPPRLIEEKTNELLSWVEIELRSGEQHAVLVVGVFLIYFLAISPFERGNGRLMRLLAGHLMRRAGYGFIPYASIERQIEELRDSYQHTLLRAQTMLWSGEANLQPWLVFFLEVLERHRRRVENKKALEQEVQDFPPLQRTILETIREHGDVDAALLLKATGANRNTLKDNLRRLVQRGVLQKTGQRRGTRYRMATAESALSGGVES